MNTMSAVMRMKKRAHTTDEPKPTKTRKKIIVKRHDRIKINPTKIRPMVLTV